MSCETIDYGHCHNKQTVFVTLHLYKYLTQIEIFEICNLNCIKYESLAIKVL